VAALTALSEQYRRRGQNVFADGRSGYACLLRRANGSLTNGPVTFKFPAAPFRPDGARDESPTI
jgi:hypothetical protein